MSQIPSNDSFTDRLMNLNKAIDPFNFADYDDLAETTRYDILSSIANYDFRWIEDWLNDTKADLHSVEDEEDPDTIGELLVECDALLDYLEELRNG